MIVRDEEEFLEGCLHSVDGVADEIVVVDTGSADSTPAIARSHRANVHFREWTDSYSEARNAGIDLATGDWILILDADERLDEASRSVVLDAVCRDDCDAYLLTQRNYCSDDGAADVILNSTCRLWRNRPEYRYERRVHEQATALRSGRVGRIEAIIHHHGDRPGVVAARDKCARYVALLEAELREHPNDPDRLHDIAVSHYVSGRFEEALGYVRRAVEAADPGSAVAPPAHSTLVGALYNLGRFEEAVGAMKRALSLGIRPVSYTHLTLPTN
jgi:glycosyltransferase involved in cell wall biosynthesis